ncbi:efflux RND transporter permease subunit [Vibrio chagasii]|nr:efflux RND transporter permease subunit [Vibrio chagasii]
MKAYIDDTYQLIETSMSRHQRYVKDRDLRQRGVPFVLALVFIFLIFAAQFESFVDPMILISLNRSSCIVGAILTLFACGQSFKHLFKGPPRTLVGLVTKHGILLVEFKHEKT